MNNSSITTWTSVLLALHIILKPLVFFVPYKSRRQALDKSYRGKTCATETADNIMLIVTAVVAGLILSNQSNLPGFLCGLWIGATLIQGYFHRFKVPLSEATRPADPQSPIKMMSYSIQAAPERGWMELGLLGGIAGAALLFIARS